MKLFEKRIGLLIDLFYCLVFTPLILFLGQTYYWVSYCPEFAYLLVAWLYVSYFIIRWCNIPKLFVGRRYVIIGVILSAFIMGSYLLTLYHLPEVTFNASSLTALYDRIQESNRSHIVWLMCSLSIGYALSMSFIQELYHQLILKKEFEYQKNNAELAVYKAQINPHFLFNTLNSIYSLIIGTSEKAENAFIKFIDIVKYTYTSVDRETVSIREEINYIDNYIELQSLRLNHHTKVEWTYEVDDDEARIPPMLMLTFLENVFKYGISSKNDCRIDISLTLISGVLEFKTRNRIMKSADVLRRDAPVGIENCRARLNCLFPGKYTLEAVDENGYFTVNLKIQLS